MSLFCYVYALKEVNLNLKVSQLEVMKFTKQSQPPETVVIADNTITTRLAAKCLGVGMVAMWNLSASH